MYILKRLKLILSQKVCSNMAIRKKTYCTAWMSFDTLLRWNKTNWLKLFCFRGKQLYCMRHTSGRAFKSFYILRCSPVNVCRKTKFLYNLWVSIFLAKYTTKMFAIKICAKTYAKIFGIAALNVYPIFFAL